MEIPNEGGKENYDRLKKKSNKSFKNRNVLHDRRNQKLKNKWTNYSKTDLASQFEKGNSFTKQSDQLCGVLNEDKNAPAVIYVSENSDPEFLPAICDMLPDLLKGSYDLGTGPRSETDACLPSNSSIGNTMNSKVLHIT